MRTIINTIHAYDFSELSEDAQQKAIDNIRNDPNYLNYEWWDFTVDWWKDEILPALGIYATNIWFSGFWSQGDGACFVGEYSYNKGWRKELKEYVGGELLTKLLDYGQELQDIQKRYFYTIGGDVEKIGGGNYSHEHTVRFNGGYDDSLCGDRGYEDCARMEDDITDILRWIMQEIYRTLKQEYDDLNSDEQIRETIECNEWEFTADGTML